MRTAIVIGAGIAGIASAIRLVKAGYTVKVFESSSGPGGKLSEFKLEGCRFDFGPSLFTMPEYVTELFNLCGEKSTDSFKYKALDEICKYFFEDGVKFSSYSDVDKFALEIESKLGYDKKRLKNYLDNLKSLYDTTSSVFLENPIKFPGTLFSSAFIKGLGKLGQFDLGLSMAQSNKKRLRNEHLAQYFNRMATYNGSSPFRAPALLKVIAALEHFKGAFFPEGGMFAIIKSLVRLAKRNGVEFYFNKRVDEIIIAKKEAKGVRIQEETILSDRVFCNMDVFMAYEKLLPKAKIPVKLTKTKPSSSALVYYWGIKGEFKELGLHNVFFSMDYKTEFDYLFSKKDISNDPTIYVHISSKLEVADAPPNCENWFVMVNAPSIDSSQNWDEIKLRVKNNIIKKLSSILDVNLEEKIFCEQITDPIIIQNKTSSNLGSIYGTNSNSILSTFFRHPHKNSKINKLHFVGGSVHPGGGIPLALLSSKIAVNQLNIEA